MGEGGGGRGEILRLCESFGWNRNCASRLTCGEFGRFSLALEVGREKRPGDEVGVLGRANSSEPASRRSSF